MATDDVKTTADSSFVTGASDELSLGYDGTNANITVSSGVLNISATRINMEGQIDLGLVTEVEVSSATIAYTAAYMSIVPEGGAASGADDVDTISGGTVGCIVVLQHDDNADPITMKDSIGNLNLAGDFTFPNKKSKMMLIKSGASWDEISRSSN